MLSLGVDFSQGASLTQATMAAWKAAGVKHVYVQYSAKLPEYLAALDGQGFIVDVYVYLYFPLSPWGQAPESRVRAAIEMCRGHAVRTIWLDVEEPTDNAGPVVTVEALKRCEAIVWVAGLQPGIYSGFWTYIDHTGNSEAFAHLPLWHADYLGVAPLPDMAKRPTEIVFRNGAYGGWHKPAVWQWWNTTMFGGHSVDMDIEEEIEEEEMFNVLAYGSVTCYPDPNGETPFNVGDFGLPIGAARYRLQVFFNNDAPVIFYHGLPDPSNREAGRTYAPYGIIEVIASPEGNFWIVGDHEITIVPLGYYSERQA